MPRRKSLWRHLLGLHDHFKPKNYHEVILSLKFSCNEDSYVGYLRMFSRTLQQFSRILFLPPKSSQKGTLGQYCREKVLLWFFHIKNDNANCGFSGTSKERL